VISQIVDKAVLVQRSGASEMRILLQPAFLGHCRLQIVSRNHGVAVRIATETGQVKEILEQHLGQLKADLQDAGLRVERFEVVLSQNPSSQDRQQSGAGRERFASLPDETPGEESPGASPHGDDGRPETRGRPGGLDLFA
jgi:flagellar hook-length control protein FliK